MWILIIVFVTVGGDSGVSITSVSGFKTEAVCNEAGSSAQAQLGGWTTKARYVCVRSE